MVSISCSYAARWPAFPDEPMRRSFERARMRLGKDVDGRAVYVISSRYVINSRYKPKCRRKNDPVVLPRHLRALPGALQNAASAL